ncbi:MAG: ubiquinone/menaquinone biosynthesis methyltransferase [candidate division NC10 bacterium]|nr:ubiquinone/menaquinone biosynthesis methyltransferase [candidate division NC10 bacterium]
MFAQVPATYEQINHLLTLGLDIAWRRRAARMAAAPGGSGWADMCTGTGETAAYLAHLAPRETKIYAVDFSHSMLTEAKRKPEAARIFFVLSNIRSLPFPDESLDLVTMSFATRNINLSREILMESFAEFYRVLKRGGRFVNLETSRPSSALIRGLRDLYVQLFVESIGSRISGSRTAYAYLAKTIRGFYSAQELAIILREAGFEEITFQRLLFGAAAIHEARKR